MSTNNQHFNVDEIFRRAMYVYRFTTYQQLAEFFGVDKATLSAWKQRNSRKAVDTVNKKCAGEHLEWIISGQAGSVAERYAGYEVTGVHRQITPAQEELLRILDDMPEAKAMMNAFIQLPPSKQRRKLRETLQELEEIEEGKE